MLLNNEFQLAISHHTTDYLGLNYFLLLRLVQYYTFYAGVLEIWMCVCNTVYVHVQVLVCVGVCTHIRLYARGRMDVCA